MDDDGTPDVIAMFANRGWYWVEAVSGKTGSNVWQRTLNSRWFQAPQWTSQVSAFAPQLAMVNGEPVLVVVASLRLLVLSLRTGESLWETELPHVTLQTPRIADLDGDGQDDVLLLAELGQRRTLLAAFSLAARRQLWQQLLTAPFEPTTEEPEQLDWPVVADLDHDGNPEILVPALYASHPLVESHPPTPWAGLDVLNGQDGSRRFRRVLERSTRLLAPVNRFIVGPDLDGDGVDEILAASTVTESWRHHQTWLYVDAVSGRDGHSVWWWRTPLKMWNDRPGQLALWTEGPDGFPLVVVSAISWPKKAEGIYVLAGGTGRLRNQVAGSFAPLIADGDGDGLPDLGYCVPEQSDIRFGRAGKSCCAAPHRWPGPG